MTCGFLPPSSRLTFLRLVGSGGGDHPADVGRAGEGGHLGAGVAGQPAADVAAAVDQVDHAGGQALLVQDLHEPGRRTGGEVAGFDHRAAADGEGERELLGDDEQREVPRRDDPDDADRLLHRDREIFAAQPVVGVAERVLGQRRRVVPDAGGAGDLVLGLGDRFARLEGLDQGEFVAFGLDPPGDPAEQGGLLGSAGPGPVAAVERPAGGGHRGVHVGFAGAAVDRDADAVGRALPRGLGAAAVHLGAVDDVGPQVDGEGGRVLDVGDGHDAVASVR